MHLPGCHQEGWYGEGPWALQQPTECTWPQLAPKKNDALMSGISKRNLLAEMLLSLGDEDAWGISMPPS